MRKKFLGKYIVIGVLIFCIGLSSMRFVFAVHIPGQIPTDGTGRSVTHREIIDGSESNWNGATLDYDDEQYWYLTAERVGGGLDRIVVEVYFESPAGIDEIYLQGFLEGTSITYYKVTIYYTDGSSYGKFKIYEGSKFFEVDNTKTIDHIEIYKQLLWCRNYELNFDYIYGVT